MIIQLYTDGGSRGNPGPAAYGYVAQDVTPGVPVQSGAVIILDKCGKYLGVTTNNQAEYAGLIAGITWVLQHYPDCELRIFMDSLLIVNQVKGEYKVKHPDMIPLHHQVKSLLNQLPRYTINYVPRRENSLADSLVNAALDAQVG